jgi:glycerophosphoryl diester phosphodiesterase
MNARPYVLGHRGAPRARPENTLAGFAKARQLGADGVELDARRTVDGTLVVHHDADIEGMGLVVDQQFAKLRNARPDIPTLAEALEACAGMLVNVEVKCLPWEPDADTDDHEVLHAVATLVREASFTPVSDVIVSSFDLGAVDACRSFAPEIATAWLTSGQDVAAAAAVATEHGHGWLNPDRASALRASTDELADARGRGLRINVWTVDDADEIVRLANAGVDAIITDVPEIAAVALGELAEPKGRRR